MIGGGAAIADYGRRYANFGSIDGVPNALQRIVAAVYRHRTCGLIRILGKCSAARIYPVSCRSGNRAELEAQCGSGIAANGISTAGLSGAGDGLCLGQLADADVVTASAGNRGGGCRHYRGICRGGRQRLKGAGIVKAGE